MCQFQRMLKHAESMKEMEGRALEAVDALLADVPFVQHVSFETNVAMRREIDILAEAYRQQVRCA